jgi:Fe-S cluster assembly protein SufD
MTGQVIEQVRTMAEQQFLDYFSVFKASLAGQGVKDMELRNQAINWFAASGLPGRGLEAYKYTDLRTLLPEILPPATAQAAVDIEQLQSALGEEIRGIDSYRVVFIDGFFAPELTEADLPAGVRFTSPGPHPAEVIELAKSDPLVALNLAFAVDGANLTLEDNVSLDKPLHLIFLNSGKSLLCERNYLQIGKNSELTVIETHVSLDGVSGQRNNVTGICLGEGAKFTHIKLQNEAEAAVHLATYMISIKAGAEYDGFLYPAGGALTRNELFIRFDGENARADISGAVILKDRQHCDTTMVVNHKAPACESRMLFKHLVDDSARGVFQGNVIVRPKAVRTDSKQMARALLLSDNAAFDAKPELEIYADDVVCGHGATTGQLDEEALFYLTSRGIPEKQAKAMLMQAFIGEALEKIGDENIRVAVTGLVAHRLENK